MLNEVDDLLTQAEGIILQDAIDNTNKTYQDIKNYIEENKSLAFENNDLVLFELYENTLETLECFHIVQIKLNHYFQMLSIYFLQCSF